MTDRYAASRALDALDERRTETGHTGYTGLFPAIVPDPDETVPLLPALVRPQAE